jgi:glycosyltransferase involved in cell wall biosynthesis
MQPWLSGAAVVALPLSTGGGIRIKTIEALCAGKAMVGTALAAEGLDLRDGQEFVMADSDRGFADAISSLLTDPARRSTLEHNARAWGETFCRPGRVRAAFESLYQRLEAVRP